MPFDSIFFPEQNKEYAVITGAKNCAHSVPTYVIQVHEKAQ